MRTATMRTPRITPDTIREMQAQLTKLRKESLNATRNGDFMNVAKLTTQVAALNRRIAEAEGLILMQNS